MEDALPPQVLVGLASLAVIVILRLRPRPVKLRRLLTGPLVVMVVGAFLLVPWLAVVTDGDVIATVGIAVVDCAFTLGLGIVRGATVRVAVDETGQAESKYTLLTVWLWALSVAARFGIAGAAVALGASPTVTEGNILLMLGLSLLTQNLVIARVAARRVLRDRPATNTLTAA